jgi:hypothetical protein
MVDTDFNVENLRVKDLPPLDLAVAMPANHQQRNRTRIFPPKASKYTAFLETWVDRLEADPRPTAAMYKLALAIQRAATLQNTLTPKLSNAALSVHRATKYRLLPRLVELGMIQVVDPGRGRGRAAVVRIILESNKPEESEA